MNKPILQLNISPFSLDIEKYVDPRSPSNPNGNLLSLLAFRNLVDLIPSFTRDYNSTGKSLEETYGLIVNSATTISPFTAQVIGNAQTDYVENTFADMDGTSGEWRPVYAVPDNWYNAPQDDLFQETDFDSFLENFTILGQLKKEDFQWRQGNSTPKKLDDRSKIQSIKFKFLIVNLVRPWLNTVLFDTNNWKIEGQSEGFCSSGRIDNNNGIIPLIPTGLLIGSEAEISGDFTIDDKSMLDSVESRNESLSLGPFVLKNQNTTPTLNVYGWISLLTPFSPAINDSESNLQWNGKNEVQLKRSLSGLSNLVLTSIIIIVENNTNIELTKIDMVQKTGTIKDEPPQRIPRKSRQGFTTYFDLTGGPEGWIVYSFNAQFNIAIYWENALTERNSGAISFIPKDVEIREENIVRYFEANSIIREQNGFLCSKAIGSGFREAVFRYSITSS